MAIKVETTLQHVKGPDGEQYLCAKDVVLLLLELGDMYTRRNDVMAGIALENVASHLAAPFMEAQGEVPGADN